MKKYKLYIFGLISILLLSGCAHSVQHVINNNTDGFFAGLWHGIILPISWIGSLFNANIAIYSCDNNGGWYDFGFILGTGNLIFWSRK